MRLLTYFVIYQVSIWLIVASVQATSESMGALTNTPVPIFGWPSACAFLALMAMVTCDAVKYVHRLVGPIYRFRKTVQSIAAGETIAEVRLRHGDFLQNFAEDFNRMLKMLEDKGAIVMQEKNKPAEAVASS